MIRYVPIGLRAFFSWYVVERKLVGGCVVSKGAEKTRFIFKFLNAYLLYPDKSRP